MNKYLPKSVKNPQGFTLVELMIAIAIIAILATIGISVFTSNQRSARDARRRGEVDSISKSLEAQRDGGTQLYNYTAAEAALDFPNGVPTDPSGTQGYCIAVATTTTPPAVATTWAATDQCPTVPTGYVNLPAQLDGNVAGEIGSTAPTARAWTLCTRLENGGFFCKQSVGR